METLITAGLKRGLLRAPLTENECHVIVETRELNAKGSQMANILQFSDCFALCSLQAEKYEILLTQEHKSIPRTTQRCHSKMLFSRITGF